MNVIKKTLGLDFDGVIHSYKSGWQGHAIIPDPPVDGAIEALWQYVEHFHVCIYSTRSETQEGIQAMQAWLATWEREYWKQHKHLPRPRTALNFMIEFPKTKPPAFLTLDDRVRTFRGRWPTVEELLNFKPWNVPLKGEPDEIYQLAERIAEALFINGEGEQAYRLVLQVADGRPLGGWGRNAAAEVIDKVLRANL